MNKKDKLIKICSDLDESLAGEILDFTEYVLSTHLKDQDKTFYVIDISPLPDKVWKNESIVEREDAYNPYRGL